MSISLNNVYLTNFLRPGILRQSRDSSSDCDKSTDLKKENGEDEVEMGMQNDREKYERKRIRHHWYYYRHFVNGIVSPEVIAKRIDDAISDFPYLYSPLDCPGESFANFRNKRNFQYRRHWEDLKYHHQHKKGLNTKTDGNEGKTNSASLTGNAQVVSPPCEILEA